MIPTIEMRIEISLNLKVGSIQFNNVNKGLVRVSADPAVSSTPKLNILPSFANIPTNKNAFLDPKFGRFWVNRFKGGMTAILSS